MPQLDPTSFLSQLFWLLIVFSLMYIIIAKSALPQIGRVLQNRKEKISSDLERASDLKGEAETLEEECHDTLQEAREAASKSILAAQTKVDARLAEERVKLDKKLQKQSADAEKKLAAARTQALDEVSLVSQDLSQDIVKKLTGMDISSAKSSNAVKSVLKEA